MEVVVLHKNDLKGEKEIILPMAEHLSQKLNAPYFETSALTGENVKNAFHKIAELVYRAKKLGDFADEELLIVRNHEETSNDNDGLEKPLDWKSKLVLLKEIQPSSSVSDSTEIENDTTHDGTSLKRRPLSPPLEMDKREKRVLETTFRYFKGSKLEKSQTELLSAIETRDLVVITSKYKFQTVLAFFFGVFFIYLFWFLAFFLLPTIDDERAYGLGLTASGVRIVVSLLIILVIGIGGKLITFAIYLKYYFIVLDSQGIYYKKIGKPRFISWADIAWIKGYMRHVRGNPTERAVKIHLKSQKEVRFNSSNYLFKRKFFDFDDVFKSFKFRRCHFFSINNNIFGANSLFF